MAYDIPFTVMKKSATGMPLPLPMPPTNGAYTFENDTLIVNQSGPGVSFMGGRAIYKCDGNVLTIKRKGHYGSEFDEVIYRYGYNLEDCTE
jgi:hypothetical protein